MNSEKLTFGRAIAQARKEKEISQKELASLIEREDGDPISPQYLNDIEHNRRSPSSDHLVKQFSKILKIDLDYLYYLVDRFPEDIRRSGLTEKEVSSLLMAFRGKPTRKRRP